MKDTWIINGLIGVCAVLVIIITIKVIIQRINYGLSTKFLLDKGYRPDDSHSWINHKLGSTITTELLLKMSFSLVKDWYESEVHFYNTEIVSHSTKPTHWFKTVVRDNEVIYDDEDLND